MSETHHMRKGVGKQALASRALPTRDSIAGCHLQSPGLVAALVLDSWLLSSSLASLCRWSGARPRPRTQSGLSAPRFFLFFASEPEWLNCLSQLELKEGEPCTS